MGLPFKKHLEWLCIEGLETKQIQDFYDNIQLPIPTQNDISKATTHVTSLIVPPAAKKNIAKGLFKKEDSWVWEKHGYGDLHKRRCDSNDSNWSTVGKLLNHPLMRTALDACSICNFEDDKIMVMLSQIYKIQLTQEALDLYRKYFGNFLNFQKTDWKKYLGRLVDDPYVYTRIFAALTKPRDEVLHLCGLPPENVFSDFLKNVLATASYKFNHYARQGSPEAEKEARKWAKVGFEAGEKFDKFGAADASDFAKLVQTEFEYVTPQIDTIDAEIAAQIRPQIEDKTAEKK